MTRLRQGARQRPSEEHLPAVVESRKPRRSEEYHTLLDAIDAALARRDDSDDARVALLQTYATVWAAIGYGIWVVVELMIRLIVAILRFLFRRKRRRDEDLEDQQWTTTMKRKGRADRR